MTQFFSLPNLRSSQVFPSEPWNWNQTRPPFGNKDQFRDWCADAATNWNFFSGLEGFNASVRVSKQNPPLKIHGIVADYDAALTAQEIENLITKNSDILPSYFSQTFSGGARLVWIFEEPFYVDNVKIYDGLMKVAKSELKLKSILPGFDPKSLDYNQYFEVGSNWTGVPLSAPINSTAVGYWFHEASKKLDLSGSSVNIPLELIQEELEKQFPARWTGDFTVGARGPLFWIQDGIDRVGCEVSPAGMICYSSRAGTAFAPWEMIFGKSFVKAYETKKYGEIVDTYWYDGSTYWYKNEGNGWTSFSKEDLVLQLKVGYGLSHRLKKQTDTHTEAENVLYSIQKNRKVDAAVPFLFKKDVLVYHNGNKNLNINKRQVMRPAEVDHPLAWGEGFPWLANFFDNFLAPKEQLDFLLAWCQRLYVPALNGCMESGHNLFIAGPPKKGKSFFSTQILRQMMDGSTDASAYLMSETAFNREMGEVAIWNVDDGTSAADWKSHNRFSEMIKKAAANQFITYHPKFKDSCSLPWCGRVVTTLNDDPQSLSMLPNLDGTILDKLMLLKCSDIDLGFSVSATENNDRVTAELPFFLRWLVDYKPPAHIVTSARFGFEPFHHPELVASARDQSPSYRFREVLELWRTEYRKANPSTTVWEGKVTDLLQSIGMLDGLHEVRGWKANIVAKWLNQIQSFTDFVHAPRKVHGYTLWKIDLP